MFSQLRLKKQTTTTTSGNAASPMPKVVILEIVLALYLIQQMFIDDQLHAVKTTVLAIEKPSISLLKYIEGEEIW